MSQDTSQSQPKGAILSRREIRTAVDRGEIKFEPMPTQEQWGEASIDLRLGFKFTMLKKSKVKFPLAGGISAVAESGLWVEKTLKKVDSFGQKECHCLEPTNFLLALTYEHIWMPRHLIGRVEGRSSYARVGLSIHQTAPWIQPGWDGQITLEFFNSGPLRLELTPVEDMPCQLTFFYLSSELTEEEAYGSRPGDTFQHQKSPLVAGNTE